MQRDEKSLLDILNSARLALDYLGDQNQEAFLQNVQLQDAVIRRLEIIGEAARRISDSKRQEWSHLPWQQMIGMRNIVIHKYDDVEV
ncbi:MAG: DUF86 domain-containing protein [Anaerolineae bacterium]|nr:DUF86 domain-containing protein [Candidatus Roseilinea sp.]MDW8450951.1 DUF86 domain-containing protein [Anaerolineae bacterium]